MLYNVDMEGIQKLMSSGFMIKINEEMNSFEVLPI
jgi:hypothetical protein